LRILAPRDGVVIPPPRVPERPEADEAELPAWTGTPLDVKNLGATLSPEGAENLLCQIGDPNEWDAVLVIDQDDIDLVHAGQEVRLMFEESAYHVFVSTIEDAGLEELTTAPPRLASTNGGPLPAQPNPDGSLRPLNTSYQAIARLDNEHGLLRNGLIGRARIESAPRTLTRRLMRYLSRTFNFDI
jgi:putative peptide zinc metalloprotease protein